MRSDTEIQEQILARLKAADTVEGVSRAAVDGFEHLLAHIYEQREKITNLQSQVAILRESSSPREGSIF